MDSIVAILRAAHCKSTHHYFAIDSLYEVPSERGRSLADLLLANYADYLKGAKDPDNVFKDFENHVLHVRDGYWGGAAKTAEKWLERSFKLLSVGNWKESAYAIGVLSHYFTDPFMPLHTAQSPRETIVHRPMEWSVCCSYQSVYMMACEDSQLESFAGRTPSDVLAMVHFAAQSVEGKRLLRDQDPPPMKTIQRWIDSVSGIGFQPVA